MIKFVTGEQEHRIEVAPPSGCYLYFVTFLWFVRMNTTCLTQEGWTHLMCKACVKYQLSKSISSTCLFVIYLKAFSYNEKTKKEAKKLAEPTTILLKSNQRNYLSV